MSLEGHPYDGHILSLPPHLVRGFLEQGSVREVFVGHGYRGHKRTGKEVVHADSQRRESMPKGVWRFMKRRAAVEPTIGHMKSEHRLERNRLKGPLGKEVNALRGAAEVGKQASEGVAPGRTPEICRKSSRQDRPRAVPQKQWPAHMIAAAFPLITEPVQL